MFPNSARRFGISGVTAGYEDTEYDALVAAGVTALECVGGRVSVIRGLTTRTKTGDAADKTFRELTTILIVDDVIPSIRRTMQVVPIRGQGKYTLELTRIYATDEAIRDGIDFMELDNFSLVVCKPDRNVIYSGCQWSQMQESAEVGGNVMEKVTVEAARRTETSL